VFFYSWRDYIEGGTAIGRSGVCYFCNLPVIVEPSKKRKINNFKDSRSTT
jgi:hypothetical protein